MSSFKKFRALLFCSVLVAVVHLVATPIALAHQTSDGYVTLTANGTEAQLRVELALRDVEVVLALDANQDGKITWAEVLAKQELFEHYITGRLSVTQDGQLLPLQPRSLAIDRHSNGTYAVFGFTAVLRPSPTPLSLNYHLLFDQDPQHRGIFHSSVGGDSSLSVFTPTKSSIQISLQPREAQSQTGVWQFVNEGIWHIWQGYDHILFLLSLLFPAVLVRNSQRDWNGVRSFRAAFWKIFGIVSSFTIAHTITLAAATLGFVTLPSTVVESAIAASVFVAAFNNLYPLIKREYIITFLFGLIHGLGFASALGDLHLDSSNLIPGLLGFNLGVETGQLAIVLTFMPIAYLARDTLAYRRAVLQFGSCVILCISSTWFVERVFHLQILGF